MSAIASDAVISAWERGRAADPIDRGLVLYELALPECDRATLADRPLGERNTALLRLRQALFGDTLAACVDCPQCSERLEFPIRASMLASRACASSAAVEVDGHRFRFPTTRDLGTAARAGDAAAASHSLLRALRLEGPVPADDEAIAALAERVAAALDRADPCLDVALRLTCPACANEWTSSLDIAAYLWDEIDARACDLLDAVHVLAKAYGWCEADVLAMTDARRAAYLDRVLG